MKKRLLTLKNKQTRKRNNQINFFDTWKVMILLCFTEVYENSFLHDEESSRKLTFLYLRSSPLRITL